MSAYGIGRGGVDQPRRLLYVNEANDTQSLDYGGNAGGIAIPGFPAIAIDLKRPAIADIYVSINHQRNSGRFQFHMYFWTSADISSVAGPGYPVGITELISSDQTYRLSTTGSGVYTVRRSVAVPSGGAAVSFFHQAADSLGQYQVGPRIMRVEVYQL